MRHSAVSILLLAAMCGGTATPLQKKSTGAPKADPFLTGRPLTLEQIQQAVGLVQKKIIPEARLREAIQNRGLDFSLPAGELDRLRDAGASLALAELIESSARPAPKIVEPPKPKAGSLVATCAPAECEVTLNGKPFGSTSGGVLKVGAYPEGKLVVDFKKDGYVSAQSISTITANATASASVTLEPDRSTKEKWGAQIFQRVMESLGGQGGLQAGGFFLANGSLTVLSADGKTVKYQLVARIKLAENKGMFLVTAGSAKHQYAFSGNQYAGNKGLKAAAVDVESDLRLFREHLLPIVMARINTPQTRFVADSPAPKPNEDLVVRAEGEGENWILTLDKNYRPLQMTLDSTGPNSGLQLFFLDYTLKDKSFLPQGIVVRRAGTPERRAEFRFDSIELNPKLKDSDFVFKRGLFR